ncbi:MAG: nitroreductase/quinone reductase family protein [Chloroflexota bacterium]
MNREYEAALQAARELTLVTKGRRSGRPRQVELWFAYEAGNVYFLASVDASGRAMNWYRNLQANPEATLQVNGRAVRVLNQTVEDAEALKRQVWDLFLAKYGGDIMRRWYGEGRHLPVKMRVVE